MSVGDVSVDDASPGLSDGSMSSRRGVYRDVLGDLCDFSTAWRRWKTEVEEGVSLRRIAGVGWARGLGESETVHTWYGDCSCRTGTRTELRWIMG